MNHPTVDQVKKVFRDNVGAAHSTCARKRALARRNPAPSGQRYPAPSKAELVAECHSNAFAHTLHR